MNLSTPDGRNGNSGETNRYWHTGKDWRISGNVWREITFALPYNVTADTILEFDFRCPVEGEIHAIGLDEDVTQWNVVRGLQLFGTQTWGHVSDYRDYGPDAPAWKHYRIPVGQFYTGQMQHLFFVSDDDNVPRDSQSYFRNVRVYEESAGPNTPIDFTQYTIGTYDAGQDYGGGTVTVEASVTRYTWDVRNRLVGVREYGSAAANPLPDALWSLDYTYDTQNRLIGRVFDPDGDTGTADPEQTRYVYDGNQVLLQFDKTGTGGLVQDDLSHRYLWGPAVDQILADEQLLPLTPPATGYDLTTPGEVLWPLTDHLGTVRDLATFAAATETTTVANHRIYDAFGNVTSETNAAIDHLFGFTGRQFDAQTALQNNLNRWYDPETGRWLSEDPIGFEAGDANLMRYVGNRATTSTDPSGTEEDGRFGFWDRASIALTGTKMAFDHYAERVSRLRGLRTPGDALGIKMNFFVSMVSGYCRTEAQAADVLGEVVQGDSDRAGRKTAAFSAGVARDSTFVCPIGLGASAEEAAMYGMEGLIIIVTGEPVDPRYRESHIATSPGAKFIRAQRTLDTLAPQLDAKSYSRGRESAPFIDTTAAVFLMAGQSALAVRGASSLSAMEGRFAGANVTRAELQLSSRQLQAAPRTSAGRGFTLVGEGRPTWSSPNGSVFTSEAKYIQHMIHRHRSMVGSAQGRAAHTAAQIRRAGFRPSNVKLTEGSRSFIPDATGNLRGVPWIYERKTGGYYFYNKGFALIRLCFLSQDLR